MNETPLLYVLYKTHCVHIGTEINISFQNFNFLKKNTMHLEHLLPNVFFTTYFTFMAYIVMSSVCICNVKRSEDEEKAGNYLMVSLPMMLKSPRGSN